MKIQNYTKILGKPINSDEVRSFIEINNFKYPKIDTITNRKLIGDRSYWVESKKNKVLMLFECVINNPVFKPIATNKKGVFYPIATDIRFEDNLKIEDIPFGLKPNMTFDELIKSIGEPHIKSSDVATVWLNDDGTESWYRWEMALEGHEHFYLGIEYSPSETNLAAIEYRIFIKETYELFHLFDEMKYESMQTFLKTSNNYKTYVLMFIKWSIERNLFCESFISQTLASDIKTGKADVLDFMEKLNKSYIAIEDFVKPTQNYIRRYIKGLNADDIFYYKDFCNLFLKNKKLISNYLGSEAQNELNKIEFNEENYNMVKGLLNQRFDKIILQSLKNQVSI